MDRRITAKIRKNIFWRISSNLISPKKLEAIDKIKLFQNKSSHKSLKVHKLKGALNDRHSFSVNYKVRIVFEYLEKKNKAALLAIGDHDIYK